MMLLMFSLLPARRVAQLHMKLHKVSLLLVEADEDPKDKDSGLLMEAAGAYSACRRTELHIVL